MIDLSRHLGSQPLVSTIIPVYNAEKFILEALASVFVQGHRSIEVIVVDDGSTDRSAEVIRDSGYPLRYEYQENRGPAAARNTGLKYAHGDLVTFLDADDTWPVDKLAQQVGYLTANPSTDIVLGRIQYTGTLSAREQTIRFEGADNTTMNVNLGSGVFRRSAFEKVGYFDESLIHYEDHDWFMRARELDLEISILDRITLNYRRHPDALCQRAPPADNEFARVFKKSLERRRKLHAGRSPELRRFFDYDERTRS